MPDDAGSSRPADADSAAAEEPGARFDRIGGVSGALVGAGIGSAAGPVGAVIGGVAGAIGGWWAGHAVVDAARSLTREDEAHFRSHFEAIGERPVDRAYDDVRGAYYLGQIASHHPDFASGEFVDMEPDLARAWASQGPTTGSWTGVREYAAAGFNRGRSKLDDAAQRARAEWERRHSAQNSGDANAGGP
jgi:hypothetical protein